MSDVPVKIGSSDLMPPESHYRPMRIAGPRLLGVASWLLLVIAFSLLILTPSLFLLALFPLVPGLVLVWRIRQNAYRANEENQRAINLLAVGEYDAAGEVFEQLCRDRWSWAHALFVFNRGVVYRMKGRPRRALSLFNAAESSGRMKSRVFRPLAPNLLIETALCHAVIGNIDEASRYLERARDLLPHHGDGRLLLTETIILLHRGLHEEALQQLDNRWRYADGALTGSSLKALRLLKAYAMQASGQEDSVEFRRMLDGIYPWRTEEFVWLTAPWPQMAAFVSSNLR